MFSMNLHCMIAFICVAQACKSAQRNICQHCTDNMRLSRIVASNSKEKRLCLRI
jgi:hypothetical protein